MRRHYPNYFRGLPGIKPYRARLVEALTPAGSWVFWVAIAMQKQVE